MKKKINTFNNTLILTIAIVLIILLIGFDSYSENHYLLKGKVIWIQDSIVQIKDNTGNVWEWELEDNNTDLTFYSNVKMTMYTNNTDIIEDDIIQRIVVENN